MRVVPTRLAISLIALLMLAGTSSAVLMDLSKEDLINNADGIVLAVVQDVSYAWAEDHSQIYTYVTLNVSDQFKGESVGPTLTVQIPGGKVGDITQVTSDTPKNLEIGAEVILHLFMKETGYYWIYGWEKGSLNVENEAIPDYMMTVNQFRQLVEHTVK